MGRHPVAIGGVLRTESSFQLDVFQPNHHRAGGDCEGCQNATDHQPCPHTPGGQHFAEVPEVDGMADARADAGGHEALIVVAGAIVSPDFSPNFGQAA